MTERLTCLLFLIVLLLPNPVTGAVVEYDLTIAEKMVDFTGRRVTALTINGGIPGPVLRFKVGDTARINVKNELDEPTSIHWHGVLLPPGMDGVPMISFPPIAPGTTFTYEYPIRHSGTYWYHSHSGLQEQRGVYGALVLEPADEEQAVAEEVILLSDWTDDSPDSVLRTLKRGSEWFSLDKGSAQSIIGAAKSGKVGKYFKRELGRMPPMDISDVAYDRFLANGKPVSTIGSHSGHTIRLRIVNGSATTFFHLEFSGSPMTIVAADGVDVEPVAVQRFLIGVAETYDVLVDVPPEGSHEFRATAHDASGHASVWIGKGIRHHAPHVPRPDVYETMDHVSLSTVFALTPAGAMGMPDTEVEAGRFDSPGMMHMGHGTMEMDHSTMPMGHSAMQMDHGTMEMEEGSMAMDKGFVEPHAGHDMHICNDCGVSTARGYGSKFSLLEADASSRELSATDGGPERPWPPYKKLRSVEPTTLPEDAPVREIKLTLDGDMERYVWLLNNRPLSETDHILIREGEVVRLIMINRTMMHHPMHLHGHFFRVLNGQGDHAPLKHTVNVEPMSTTVIEFYAGEFGDWFFHCHLLYHMKSGMARVWHYEGFSPGEKVETVRPKLYGESWYAWADLLALSQMSEGVAQLSSTRNILKLDTEAGWGRVDGTEWEAIPTYGRYFNRFFTVFVGGNFEGEDNDADKGMGILGFGYLMPLNIESAFWVSTEGTARLMLDKHLELTPRISLVGEAEYDTEEKWEASVDLKYMLSKSLSLVARHHTHYGTGGGIEVRF